MVLLFLYVYVCVHIQNNNVLRITVLLDGSLSRSVVDCKITKRCASNTPTGLLNNIAVYLFTLTAEDVL